MHRLTLAAALLVIGIGWALTLPLSKIVVSFGYQPFGLIFWQTLIGAAFLGTLLAVRGQLFRPTRRQWMIAITVALVGTLLPNYFSFRALANLPAGIVSILLSLIPMISFPIAILMATDRFDLRRFAGLAIGLVAVLLIVLPDASLPDPAMLLWVPIALIAPVFYAMEGNIVVKIGTAGMTAVQTLFLASAVGAVLSLPLALVTGQMIWPVALGMPEAALALSAAIHALVYSGYVWIVGRAGAIFAVQVSYLVTIFGVIWSVILLSEAYAPTIWASLVLMLAGMALVQPRPGAASIAPLPDAGPDA
ncbi:DMT family transporter [Pseudooceanicola sp. C21-150M6]|uniref:DMT family transporter n=1 Tax=Pseudooceanicola sp. C21-150M6 TaxID=3434355 RepID=UPI003D7F6421